MSNVWKAAIHERDGNRCKICGSIHNLTIQHKKPKCKGGASTPENCVTWCREDHRLYHEKYGLMTSDDYGHPLYMERNKVDYNKPKHKHQHFKHKKNQRFTKHHKHHMHH